MKKLAKIIFLIVSLVLFLTGCSTQEEQDIEFAKDVVVNYKSKADSTQYVKTFMGDTIEASQKDSEDLKIYLNSTYYIECPKINTNKLGKQKIVYKYDDKKFILQITVADIEGPKLKVDTVDFEVLQDDPFDVNAISYTVIDNLTDSKKIVVSKEGEVNTSIPDTYKIKFIAEDEKGNFSKEIVVTVNVKEKPKKEEPKEETKDNDSKDTNKDTQNTVPTKDNQSNLSAPSKIFKTADYGYDLARTMNAAIEYKDSILNSRLYKEQNGNYAPYVVDGVAIGYIVTFY